MVQYLNIVLIRSLQHSHWTGLGPVKLLPYTKTRHNENISTNTNIIFSEIQKILLNTHILNANVQLMISGQNHASFANVLSW